MEFRNAHAQDLPQIMALIGEAKAFLKSLGVSQWQTEYPTEDDILADISAGGSYVLCDDTSVIATFAFLFGEEPTYKVIDGAWKSTRLYGTLHRMSVSNACKGKGLSRKIMDELEIICQKHGITSIKIDTHPDNPVMNRLLKGCGYEYCGVIQVEEGPRLAYEKLLAET